MLGGQAAGQGSGKGDRTEPLIAVPADLFGDLRRRLGSQVTDFSSPPPKRPALLDSPERCPPRARAASPAAEGLSVDVQAALTSCGPVWAAAVSEPEVCVAVLDGPVDLSHPCFDGANIRRLDGYCRIPLAEGPMSVHGTHIASLIFGQPDSSVVGITPQCRGLIAPVFRDFEERHLSQLDLVGHRAGRARGSPCHQHQRRAAITGRASGEHTSARTATVRGQQCTCCCSSWESRGGIYRAVSLPFQPHHVSGGKKRPGNPRGSYPILVS